MTHLTFHASVPLNLRTGEPAECTCGGRCQTRQRPATRGGRSSLIEAAMRKMPHANASTRAALHKMTSPDLEHLVKGLAPVVFHGNGYGQVLPVDDVALEMANISTFRNNSAVAREGLAPGIIYSPGYPIQDVPSGNARFHVQEAGDHADMVPPSSRPQKGAR